MYEPHDLTPPDDEFATRLRTARPSPPRLDRDRLMYLAGQRSVTPVRKSRPLWPVLTVAAWAACVVLVGLAFARPPRVVTETKIVERVVEVPAASEIEAPDAEAVPVAVTDTTPAATAANPEPPFDFAFLDDLQRPLTALASRPSLFENLAQPAAVPTVESPTGVVELKQPQTYAELRRELLGTEQRPAFPGPLRWF
ncbi:MAG: hypothetical protein WBC44_12990 [Planctomycetaceae bacterium]